MNSINCNCLPRLITIILIMITNVSFSQTFDLSENSTIHNIKKKFKVDSIQIDYGNEDGIYVARNKKSKKWGMYQYYETKILPEYDSINFYKVNAPFTTVWKNGKVGIVNSPWNFDVAVAVVIVPCIYDNFKIEIKENNYNLKTSKDKKWGMIDWQNGNMLIDFIYKDPNDY